MSFFEFPHTRNYDSDLGWLIKTMHEVLENVEAQNAAIEMYKTWTEEHVTEVERVAADLQNFVNTYFDNLDVQQEINNKITAMAEDGSLLAVLADPVRSYVEDWIASYLTPTQPPVDSSLTIAGAAADAKVTGENITKLENNMGAITDTKIIALDTYSHTGTYASVWYYDLSFVPTDNMYIQLLSTENVTATGRKIWLRIRYTDDTYVDTSITNVGEWYKINVATDKTVREILMQFTRSDSALSTAETSKWTYSIIEGEPLEIYKNEINLRRDFVFGISPNSITIDTTTKQITIPTAAIFLNGTTSVVTANETAFDYNLDSANIIVVYNYTTRAYEIHTANEYRMLKSDEFGAVIIFRKDDPSKYNAAFPVQVNGYTPITSDKSLSYTNAAADGRQVGLLHPFISGAIIGKINIDTAEQKVSVPLGVFFKQGANDLLTVQAAELDYSSFNIYVCLVVNIATGAYELVNYGDYRSASLSTYQLVLVFRRTDPEMNSTVYPLTINGYTDAVLNESGVPSYWISELDSKINAAALLQTYNNGITFGFITDIHWETNHQQSPKLVKYIANNSRVDMWLNGGDTATGDQGDGQQQMQWLFKAMGKYNGDYRFYSINGNHDNNAVGGSTVLTPAEIKNLIMPHYENVTFGNGNYYYFDYCGTRFICLDTGNYGSSDSTQTQWVANIAQNSALPVIIVMHIIRVTYTDTEPCPMFNDLISAIGANTDGKVKMIIGGHTHHDFTFTASNGIPVIALDTDSRFADDGIPRNAGTISEQCMSIITADYDTKIINVTRIGTIGQSFTVTY